MEDPNERRSIKSLTKKQRQTEAGIQLLSLCQTVTSDGRLTEEEVSDLRQWLSENRTGDLPAIACLAEVIDKVAADGVITASECREVYKAIEVVLPPDVRASVRQQRQHAEQTDREAERVEKKAQRERDKPIERADFMVAGCRYEGRPIIILRYVSPGDPVVLVRDPGNIYSTNAIEVRTKKGQQFGYVPEIDACVLAPLFDQGCKCTASVKKILGYGRVPIPVVIADVFGAEASNGEPVARLSIRTAVHHNADSRVESTTTKASAVKGQSSGLKSAHLLLAVVLLLVFILWAIT